MKKDYIINEVPCHFIPLASNVSHPNESTDLFGYISLSKFTIQLHASVYIGCRLICPSGCVPHSYGAALGWYHGELKMNWHRRCWHNDTVVYSRGKPKGDIQIGVGYQVWYGLRGVVLCNWCDVEIVQDDGGMIYTEGKEREGVGWAKGFIYLCFLVQLVRYDNCDTYPVCCWLRNTQRPSLHLATPPGT